MKTALTIAGTDPSGGAGIQADIKTMTANGVYAMSAVTALVAQNTTGVKSIMEVTPEFLAEQLDCVFTDIMPDAVKTGMVSSVPLIQVIDYIKSTGLNYQVGPFETTIEGESYDQLMDIVKECQHVAVRAGAPKVSAYVKVVYRPDGEILTIDQKIGKYQRS